MKVSEKNDRHSEAFILGASEITTIDSSGPLQHVEIITNVQSWTDEVQCITHVVLNGSFGQFEMYTSDKEASRAFSRRAKQKKGISTYGAEPLAERDAELIGTRCEELAAFEAVRLVKITSKIAIAGRDILCTGFFVNGYYNAQIGYFISLEEAWWAFFRLASFAFFKSFEHGFENDLLKELPMSLPMKEFGNLAERWGACPCSTPGNADLTWEADDCTALKNTGAAR